MNDLLWIRSPAIFDTLSRATIRYENFFTYSLLIPIRLLYQLSMLILYGTLTNFVLKNILCTQQQCATVDLLTTTIS
jgi:uncharacterized membrane protein YoaT (DUF817 family)